MKKLLNQHCIVFDFDGQSLESIRAENRLQKDSLGTFQSYNILLKNINQKIRLGQTAWVSSLDLSVSQIQKIIDLAEQLQLNVYFNNQQPLPDVVQKNCKGIDTASIYQPDGNEHTQLFKYITQRGFSGISAIGDIHADFDRFREAVIWAQKNNHFVMMLGDLFNYGNQNFKVLDLAYDLICRGEGALCRGNHDVQFFYNLTNRKSMETSSLSSCVQYRKLSNLDQKRVMNQLLTTLNNSYWWYQAANVVFAHAAWHPDFSSQMHSKDVEKISLFGYSEYSKNQWIQHHAWIDSIPKNCTVIVGHETVSLEFPQQRSNANGGQVIFLDTGCSKNGYLSSVDLTIAGDGLKLRNFNRF
jgi:hypothetical protein